MSSATKPKILAVDDDKRNLVIIEHILEDNYDLKMVDSGDKAWKVVSSFHPDIILLDIMMPGMDGYELCQKIRNDKRLRTIKIILVSGKIGLDSRLKGYDYGADDYLTKPFEAEELLAKIQVFLRLKHYEEVDSLKSSFLNLISHETKTPISQILGYAELLLDTDLTDEQSDWVQVIIKAANMLHDNSNKTLLLSQLKKGIELKKEQQVPAELIQSTINTPFAASEQKGVSFDIQVDETSSISIDSGLFKQALQYVLDNAIKFSPEQGVVTIVGEQLEDHLEIRISDQGPGISVTPIDDIFSEFGEDDILHHQEGLKISLAIARSITEAHGGSLSAYNNADAGATFLFRLPL